MGRVLIVAFLVLLGLPAGARAQVGADAESQWQGPPVRLPAQYPPQYPPPYPSPYPPFRPAPPVPLTEDEWGRWLLRSREQVTGCRKSLAASTIVTSVGLAAALNNEPNPSPADLAMGRTGKRETFAYVVGVATFVGGGLGFMTSARCASYAAQTVRQLELEGRRRGFAPPTPPALTTREWVSRIANAEATRSAGKWMAMGGSAVMLAAGSAIRNYHPRPDQRNIARLGPGITIFLLGYGVTAAGTALWASGAADVRSLNRRQPPPGTTVSITPRARGIRIGTVLRF